MPHTKSLIRNANPVTIESTKSPEILKGKSRSAQRWTITCTPTATRTSQSCQHEAPPERKTHGSCFPQTGGPATNILSNTFSKPKYRSLNPHALQPSHSCIHTITTLARSSTAGYPRTSESHHHQHPFNIRPEAESQDLCKPWHVSSLPNQSSMLFPKNNSLERESEILRSTLFAIPAQSRKPAALGTMARSLPKSTSDMLKLAPARSADPETDTLFNTCPKQKASSFTNRGTQLPQASAPHFSKGC